MCPIGQEIINNNSIFNILKVINYQGYILIGQERYSRNSDTSLRDAK